MKTAINYGALFRSAHCFGADFVFLIGRRFKKQSSDTAKSYKHLPLFEYGDIDDFLTHRPYDCRLVGIEICDGAQDLKIAAHPERALYILGQEDGSLPQKLLDKCQAIYQIPTKYCLNVAVAGSIVLYDRKAKE